MEPFSPVYPKTSGDAFHNFVTICILRGIMVNFLWTVHENVF